MPAAADLEQRIEYYNQLERKLNRLFDTQRDAFPRGQCSDSSDTVALTRFVDLRTVHTCWCGGQAPASPAQMHQSLARLQRQLTQQLHNPLLAQHNDLAFNLLWLARHEPPTVVWVTPRPSTPAQSEPTAREWVRRLALPGYQREQDYRDKVGLVAVEYALDAQKLYKPTVIEAQNTPHYFPGYQSDTQGRTAPLDSLGQLPWCRTDLTTAGCIEYVHSNCTLAETQPTLRYLGDF